MRDRTLSLCMIVRDEERRIATCLDSVRLLVDEMIVVDTGSTDGTAHVAAQAGAKTCSFDFSSIDFAAARNFGLAQASGGWILVLDADEVLDGRTAGLVKRCMDFGDNAGHFFERRNYNARSRQFTTDYVVRLFPNRMDFRFHGRVHETVNSSIRKAGGRLQRTTVLLNHFFSEDDEQRRRKNKWYIELLKEELAANPNDDRPLDFLAAEYHQLGQMDLAAEAAESIAQLRPLDPRAHLSVGIYRLIHKADPQSARAAFEQALKLRPGYLEALTFLQKLDREAGCAINQ
jgi:glycosyltransferase involved in cell wall biosynthesis